MSGGFNPSPYKGRGTPGRRARGKGGRNPVRNPQPGFGGGGGGGGGNKGCGGKKTVYGFFIVLVGVPVGVIIVLVKVAEALTS